APSWDAARITQGTIFGLGGTPSQRLARMRPRSGSTSAPRKRRIAGEINWGCGKACRLEAAHQLTALSGSQPLPALSGSTFFKPPALPEVTDFVALATFDCGLKAHDDPLRLQFVKGDVNFSGAVMAARRMVGTAISYDGAQVDGVRIKHAGLDVVVREPFMQPS